MPLTAIKRSAAALGLALLALAACVERPIPVRSGAAPAAVAAAGPVARPAPEKAGAIAPPRPAVHARRQMVAAANPLAAAAGLEMLRAGGSAADAAIATQLVLNLVEPQSSGIGGGGFLLYYDRAGGEVAAYDGRETAPAAATPDQFLDAAGKPLAFYDAVVGGLSVGTPGGLRLLEQVHRDHGRLPWAALFQPAIRLAEQGFPVSPRLHRLIAADKYLKTQPAAAAYFFDAEGAPLAVGTTLRNPALARTVRRIAAEGADAFYTGAIARDVVAAVAGAARPGRLALADLAAYRAVKRDALCRGYRIWTVCGMPPPSSGGVAVLQILGLLEDYEMGSLPPESVAAVHLVTQAERLAYADRARYLADPAFVPVPVAELVARDYLRHRAAAISPLRDMGTATAGTPSAATALAPQPADTEHLSTTQISVVDAAGDAVSFTTTIENEFGSRLLVDGFLLNNQLTDFSFRPATDDGPVANRVEPGKRPRSSMAPTIVLDRQGRLRLVVGSPGGASIIGYVARVLIGTLDQGLDIQQAIELPNYLNPNAATQIERGTVLERIAPTLEAIGHKVEAVDLTSGLQGIMVEPGGLVGGADPRREGVAVGD
ncbi:MAG: gamma-glutamyltransferase [Dongiaceae bacterium]